MTESVVVLGAARTTMGRFQGAFSSLSAHDLGGVAIKAAVERSGEPLGDVGEVLVGSRGKRRGTATLCIAGGEATAVAIELC